MVTEYETQGWFSRIGGSIKGIFGGILIFLLAIPLIFFNECRAVDRAEDLEYGLGSVVTIDDTTLDPSNEGKLVHIVGEVKVDETLNDSKFGISENGLALMREVEMYQWVEHVETSTDKEAGGKKVTRKDYTYEQEWSSALHDSSKYKETNRVNPGSMPYDSESFEAKNATLGPFTLTSSTLDGLGVSEARPVTAQEFAEMPAALQSSGQLHDGIIYIGPKPLAPAIGDVRISFSVRKPGVASIVSGQYGSELKAFSHKKLNNPLVLAANGEKAPDVMFQDAQDSNTLITWIIRLVTFLMMFGGLAAVFKPLSVIADVIPLIGSVVGAATSVVAFLIAMPIWLLCVAAAWIVARPLVGILLLVGVVLCVVGLIFAVRTFKKKQARG